MRKLEFRQLGLKEVNFGMLGAVASALLWIIVLTCPVAYPLAGSTQNSTQDSTQISTQSAQRGPVLVELFTSEGCSSCPPADAVLARLDAAHAVGDAPVIVLSEHVTYWDRLGWRDPFSLEQVTLRQQKYASQFGLDSVYTPQAVVDGHVQVVGSEEGKLIRAVTEAASAPKKIIALRDVHAFRSAASTSAIGFSLQGDLRAGEFVTIVIAKDSAQSSVLRGENGGRTLQHVAVVRFMTELSASSADGRALSVTVPQGDAAGTDPLRLIAFVTERKTGHIVGAAEALVRR